METVLKTHSNLLLKLGAIFIAITIDKNRKVDELIK
jgi:hypothetical protein